MQTSFTPAALADPAMQASEKILRTCVHCGFCTATCPTYLLLGDELDSPRGRIYLIKDMFETGKPATPEVVKHIDRCLSCLACMTTCPSGVHYMHLVDHARAHIEATYRRPWHDRALRAVLARVLPYPNRFRLALFAANLAKPFKNLVRALPAIGPRLAAMLDLAPGRPPARSPAEKPGVHRPSPSPRISRGEGRGEGQRDSADGSPTTVGSLAVDPSRRPSPSPSPRKERGEGTAPRRARVALLAGCAQPVLAPQINDATIRLLTRHGVEVVVPEGEGCCGALVHHLGRERESHAQAKRQIDAWTAEIEGEGLDAIVITASGCGTTIKDYGFMFRDDPAWAARAAKVSALAKDITEFLEALELQPTHKPGLTVAYHSACSMQHGQQLKDGPKRLLARLGFKVKDVPEGHICCGSAGTYNMLQPELSARLRARKVGNIARVAPDVVATGNLGCIAQIGRGFADTGRSTPIVHTVELLDWATGGPRPEALPLVSTQSPLPASAGRGSG